MLYSNLPFCRSFILMADYPLHSLEDHKFMAGSSARPLRIMAEYFYPASVFAKEDITDTIVFFGSSRIYPPQRMKRSEDISGGFFKQKGGLKNYCRYFAEAVELAQALTKWGQEALQKTNRRLLVTTGGGPGIMEAANRGADLAGGESVGLNIELPFEPSTNRYITKKFNFLFHYFFMRKYWFLYFARAMIVFPGGFGTLDELFETLTLQQTAVIKNRIPIFLYGREFWNRLVDFSFLVESGLIAPEDMNLITFVDTVPEAMEHVCSSLSKTLELA